MESLVGMALQQLALLLSALQASITHDPILSVLLALVIVVWAAHFALVREINKSALPVKNRGRELRH